MNIISGKFRGRKLASVDMHSTRPTLARVKESMFCMIDEYIYDSTVLDLFAGSGALGIECISRGAKKVFFCDAQKEALKVLNSNLLNIPQNYEVLNCDYALALKKLQNEKFDLVFLDPPYNSTFGEEAIKLLARYNMLSKDAIIVFEHDIKKDLQSLPKDCIIKKQKVYGLQVVTIIEFKG